MTVNSFYHPLGYEPNMTGWSQERINSYNKIVCEFRKGNTIIKDHERILQERTHAAYKKQLKEEKKKYEYKSTYRSPYSGITNPDDYERAVRKDHINYIFNMKKRKIIPNILSYLKSNPEVIFDYMPSLMKSVKSIICVCFCIGFLRFK